MALEDLFNGADAASNEITEQFTNLFQQVMSIPDDSLNENSIDVVIGMISGSFTEKMRKDAIASIIKGFKDSMMTRKAAVDGMQALCEEMHKFIDDLKPSEAKRQILNVIVANLESIFTDAADEYQEGCDIVIPMIQEEGAVLPTYAHPTDAAADLYANEEITLAPHAQGVMIKTGLKFGLPDGWAAYIVPRSSTGVKTPLRQSNCFGVIDSHYRGPVNMLFDNISDSEYTIRKGDRLAQMFVMPVYRFFAKAVDELDETDRNEGGFGSTGK